MTEANPPEASGPVRSSPSAPRPPVGPNLFPRTVLAILEHPLAFPRRFDLGDRDEFLRALEFLGYSIIFTALVLLPVYLKHGAGPAVLGFVIRTAAQYALYGVLLHLSLELLGARQVSTRGTLLVYAYLAGMVGPLTALAQYPILLDVGPGMLFASLGETMENAERIQARTTAPLLLAQWSVAIAALVVTLFWFSWTHRISKLRVFFAGLLAGLAVLIAQFIALNPMFNALLGWLENETP